MNRSEASSWLVWGLYLFGVMLVVSPLIDLTTTVWPLRPGDLGWRYGFLGLAAGYLSTPILGLTVLILVGHWTHNRALLKVLGWSMMLGTALVLLSMGMFMLDVLQMRGLREADVQQAVLLGGVFQEVKYGMAAAVLAALGFGSLRTAQKHARDSAGRRDRAGIVSAR